MPIQIEGPDGQMHVFDDNTPMDTITGQLSKTYGTAVHAPTPPPDPTQPPGTQPGGLQASMNAEGGDPTMVPLSPTARGNQLMSTVFGMAGNRAGETGFNAAVQNDPTFQSRKAQATALGKNAALLATKQEVGKRIFDEFNNMESKVRAWQQHAPGAFNGATGRWNSNNWVQDATGFMNPGASNLHTLLTHDIDKLTNLYRQIPGTGPGGVITDQQAEVFKDAIGQWMQERSAPGAWAVISSAKDMIRAQAGLSPNYDAPQRPLAEEDVAAINEHASQPMAWDDPRVTGVPGLHIGQVVNGYKFLGGNAVGPHAAKNWEKVQ